MSSQKRRPRRSKPGDLAALKREIWAAVLAAGDLLEHHDPQTRLRAVHGVTQAGNVFRAVVESADLEARIRALEGRAEQENR